MIQSTYFQIYTLSCDLNQNIMIIWEDKRGKKFILFLDSSSNQIHWFMIYYSIESYYSVLSTKIHNLSTLCLALL